MNKVNAKKKVIEYLKINRIKYQTVLSEGCEEIYLSVNDMPTVIGKTIETTISFEDEGLACKSFYCQPVVKTEEEINRAARFIAYINHNLNWDCNDLFEHTYGMIEEDGDIYNYCYCRYELVEEFFEDTMSHILNFSVQQLADVCIPLIGYICGKSSWFEAAKVGIDHNIKGCPIPGPED